MMRRTLLILGALAALTSCGTRKNAAPAALTRPFPAVDIPVMIEAPDERAVYLAKHFWDKFTLTDSLYHSDSVTVNGVPIADVEQQMGFFASLLGEQPLEVGIPSMERLFDRAEAFQRAHPEGNVFPELERLTTHYFYDPNSPFRSEDLYLPFVERLSKSPLAAEDYRQRYLWEARMCALNRTGSPAADFVFVDTAGKRRTLYGIKARKILLIFGNPDCAACKEIAEALASDAYINEMIGSGALKVVDIYIDEEIGLWKERIADYPASWINGYDPSFVIRTDLLYHVRAVPSLYLLDGDKTVLLKDATPEPILNALF